MLQSYFIKLVFRLYFKRIMYYLTQTIADSASILCEIPVNVNVNKGKWLASTYWRKKVVLNSRKTSCFLACLLTLKYINHLSKKQMAKIGTKNSKYKYMEYHVLHMKFFLKNSVSNCENCFLVF